MCYNKNMKKICIVCGCSYEAKTDKSRFCSTKCYFADYRRRKLEEFGGDWSKINKVKKVKFLTEEEHQERLAKRREYYHRRRTPQVLAHNAMMERKRRAKHREAYLETDRKRRYALKIETLKAYGGKCACCGEDIVEFLTIDHINGGAGGRNRQKTQAFYATLKRLGFPTDEYQCLCYNCNCAKGVYGECPHKTGGTKV